jgi:SAM-dependent methyltransferase
MHVPEAATLIAPAIHGAAGVWADLGAGTGVFSRALASLLGPTGRVYAVDRDPAVRRLARYDGLVALHADFTTELELPPLDGALLANSLHFVPVEEQARVVRRIAQLVRPGGRLVVVEYEGRAPSRWVPFPVSLERFGALVKEAGLGAPIRVGSRRSAFGGTMYAAVAGR